MIGSGSKSGKHKESFHTIPKIVSNQGQEHATEETRGKKRKQLNQIGLPIQEIDFTSDIASTASYSCLDTNLNEPSCGTSCDGGEETDAIFEAGKSTSTDGIEITVLYQVNEKKQKRSIAVIHEVNILDALERDNINRSAKS